MEKELNDIFNVSRMIGDIPVSFNPTKGEYTATFPNGIVRCKDFSEFKVRVKYASNGTVNKFKDPIPVLYGDIMTGEIEENAFIKTIDSNGTIMIQIKTAKGGHKQKKIQMIQAEKHIFTPTKDNVAALNLIAETYSEVTRVMNEYEDAQEMAKPIPDLKKLIPAPPKLEVPPVKMIRRKGPGAGEG